VTEVITDDREFLYEIKPADQAIYDRVLPRQSRLLDTLETIDWDAFVPILRSYHCVNSGAPGYSLLRLLKLEFLKYFFRLSDRQVVERANTDLLFRYFLGLSVTAKLPSHTALTRFRGHMTDEGFAKVFDQLVAQARDAGLIQDKLRITDATHLYSAAAIPTTLTLLAQLRERMIDAIQGVSPIDAQGFRLLRDRMKTDSETLEAKSKLQTRIDLVEDIQDWIIRFLADQPSRDHSAWRKLQSVHALAAKILDDCNHPSQGDRTRSIVDPDVRTGMHHGYYDGYMIEVMMDADSELITMLDVLPANGAEARSAVDLIRQEEQVHGNDVEALSIDGIGFNGAVLRELTDPKDLAIEVIVPPTDFQKSEGFASSEFQLNEDGTRVICPAGQTSNKGYTKKDKSNSTYFDFSASKCLDCPLLSQCHPGMKPTSRTGRRVNKNEYESDYQAARDKTTTQRYQEVRQRHPAIERKLNEIVRHHGGRMCLYFTREKVRAQQLMTCFGVNLKRISLLLTKEICLQ
jgi:transposase